MSAEFTQTVRGANDVLVQESQGQIAVRKPGFMRWTAQIPYQEEVVIDGQRIWFHDQDLEQVTVRDFHEDLRQLPAMIFTSDQKTLAAAFDVTRKDNEWFELVPHDKNHYIRKLSLRWHNEVPAELVIEDNLANRTHLRFAAVVLNGITNNELFVFIVPEGVNVLDQTGQPQP
jgi:outer membrane lipoprotein carrier protein